MTPEEAKAKADEAAATHKQLMDRVAKLETDNTKSTPLSYEELMKIPEVKAIQDKLDGLELKMKRPGFDAADAGHETKGGKVEKSLERKAVEKLCRMGEEHLTPEERKALILADDTTGGYLSTSELDREIAKVELEISEVDVAVRVRNTSKRSIRQSRRKGTFSAVWVSEQGTRAETAGLSYTMDEIPNHEIYFLVPVSVQDLEDSDYDLEVQIIEEGAEQFAVAKGKAVISGTANGQPQGILTATLNEETSGDANLITYDGLVKVSHNGNSNYMKRGEFWFNLKTLGKLRLLKDTTNQPIWQAMAEGAPASVLGRPYRIMPDMPDVAANNYPVVFGDFKRAYTLVNRIGIQIIRDPLSAKKSGVVEIMGRKRIGGQVMLPEALRKLKIAV